MSFSAVVFEGARRAATYAAMLFSLNAPAPAAEAAPPGTAVPQVAVLPLDGSLAATGLTLAAHHVDMRIAGGVASVQLHLLLRNDTDHAIPAQYLLPYPARFARGASAAVPGDADVAALCEQMDLPAAVAEAVEAAPGHVLRTNDVVVIAPAEQVGVEVLREVPVVRAAAGAYRLRLPLPFDPAAPWVPRFSADVLVEAGRPVRRLSSPTHPVLVDGIGERVATLSVVDGVVHRAATLEVEFELDERAPRPAALALDRRATGRDR